MAGAQALREWLAHLDGAAVRVIGAPCIGRCEHAPAAVVGRHHDRPRHAGRRRSRRPRGNVRSQRPSNASISPLIARTAAIARSPRASPASAIVDAVIAELESSALRGLGGAGFPDRPQVEDRPRGARAAADGRQHRRGRARHVQGPLLPRARSASLPRRHADRRVGGRHRPHLRLSARRVRGVPRDPPQRARGARRRSAVLRCRRSICGAAPARTSAAKSRR